MAARPARGANEREERIAAVASADLEWLACPAPSSRRVGGARSRVTLASLRAGVPPVALRDRVDIGCFSNSLGQRLRVGQRK